MPTITLQVEISDEHAEALRNIKPFLIEDSYGDLTEESTLDEVYAECSERGLSLLTKIARRRGVPWWQQVEDWEREGKHRVGIPAWMPDK